MSYLATQIDLYIGFIVGYVLVRYWWVFALMIASREIRIWYEKTQMKAYVQQEISKLDVERKISSQKKNKVWSLYWTR